MRRAYRPGVRAFRAAGLACLISLTATALAHAATDVGWVFADQPDAPPNGYTPDAAYSFNSAGGAITVGRSETGQYYVDFNGLWNSAQQAGLSAVLVSAYNTSNRCTTGSPMECGNANILVV